MAWPMIIDASSDMALCAMGVMTGGGSSSKRPAIRMAVIKSMSKMTRPCAWPSSSMTAVTSRPASGMACIDMASISSTGPTICCNISLVESRKTFTKSSRMVSPFGLHARRKDAINGLAQLLCGHRLGDKTLGTGGQRLFDFFLVTERADHDHTRRRVVRANLLDRLNAALSGHDDVHQHDVRLEAFILAHRLVAIGGFARH